jgi:hypothetical protein
MGHYTSSCHVQLPLSGVQVRKQSLARTGVNGITYKGIIILASGAYEVRNPPSANTMEPVMKSEARLARNSTIVPISSGSPSLFSGTRAMCDADISSKVIALICSASGKMGQLEDIT